MERTMSTAAFTHALILLLSLCSQISACPDLCRCSGRAVSCPDSAVIPEDIPKNTQLISFRAHLFTNIPSYTFVPHQLDTLEGLELEYGNLETIGPYAFYGLPVLETLQLRSNNINFISPKAFNGLRHVRVIYLTDNKLQQLSPRQFEGLDNLRWMSISQNSILEIPQNAFQGLENLESLYIRYNHLSQLTNLQSFKGLQSLKHLSFENNQGLRFIRDQIFSELSQLEKLDLGGNQISAGQLTESTFEGLHNLRTLILNDNPLVAVPAAAFKAIPQLQALFMSEAQLEFIQPGAFQYLPNLHGLTMDKNYQLNSIPHHCFQDNPRLQLLKLSENSIRELNAETFANASSLYQVAVSRTRLSQLHPATFFNFTNIQDLDLSNNVLTSLPADIFTSIPFSSSLRIDLRNNPWACDCHLWGFLGNTSKLYTASQINRVFNISKQQPQCFNPPHLVQKSIFTLHSSNLTCSTLSSASDNVSKRTVLITSLSLGIAVAIAIISATCVFCRKCKQSKNAENVQFGSQQNFLSMPLDDSVSVEDLNIEITEN